MVIQPHDAESTHDDNRDRARRVIVGMVFFDSTFVLSVGSVGGGVGTGEADAGRALGGFGEW